ncbi:hypothetical protein QR680_012176 [Steinernema hermaphroditum]|uniref:Uncharacterized protein n=1 Tax=Steinernema hermaphroditum TaxID=289476 RepID=A0AA39LZE8_9BILA|nr:hypothetical protein QR680_012176 [Steinernema hermaphroditum]
MSHTPATIVVVRNQEEAEGSAQDATERLLNIIARLESKLEAREAMLVTSEKLKSARLNLQFALNAD